VSRSPTSRARAARLLARAGTAPSLARAGLAPALARTAVAVLLVLTAVALNPGAAHAMPSTRQLSDHSVTATVTSVSPNTPPPTTEPHKVRFNLTLVNTTATALDQVSVQAIRGAPITTQQVLDDAIAHPSPPDPNFSETMLPMPLTAPLRPHATVSVQYVTMASLVPQDGQICLCFQGIYPIAFTVVAAPDLTSAPATVGTAQTFLPSFPAGAVKPVQVSWIWPLIDRPHRRTKPDVFIDDALATSVAGNGRLDRALKVVERVTKVVPLTLVVDPELIDELAVMSGGYRVSVGGKETKGTGSAAAQQWLARLRNVVKAHQVSLTPYADPDIDAVIRANLAWSAAMPPTEQARVVAALGGQFGSDVLWPAGGTITQEALATATNPGTPTVVLDSAALPAAATLSPRPDALTVLPTTGGRTTYAVVTDPITQTLAGDVVTTGKRGNAALPELLAELAIRAVQEPGSQHYVVVAADRYVDPDVASTVQAIRESSRSLWSGALTLKRAVATVRPVEHGALTTPVGDPNREIPAKILDDVHAVQEAVTALNAALPDATARQRLVGDVPAAVQRAESSAWRRDPALGMLFSAGLLVQLTQSRNEVSLARPTKGTYTLASADSDLFVTVVNNLPYRVRVRVALSTVGGVLGFTADDPGEQEIAPHQRLTLRVHAHAQRAGRFEVQAVVHAPNGSPLGQALDVSVNSTALGGIGVITTAVASGILVLALLIRILRRLRSYPRRTSAPPTPATEVGA
jgi:hypothetical protein